MMIFDTHAHYDDEQFDNDRDEILLSMKDKGIGNIVNVSAAVRSWSDSLDLAHKYPFVYATVGVHPDEVGDLNEENFAHMSKLCEDEKCVAIGEIGLDYHWNVETKEVQKHWFLRQLELARKKNLPVVIHSRDAAADTFAILSEKAKDLKCIVHCYSYSKEQALEYVKMGYMIGIGGVVTFNNAKKLKDVVAEIPLANIVLETDCPYLAPQSHRGKRNNSSYLHEVAQKVAELKGVSYEEVVETTTENAMKFYNISQ